MPKEADRESRMTLSQYIAENDKLLAALGIFSGLAVFSQDLERKIKYIPSILSFLFLGLTLVTGAELFARFPKGKKVLAVTLYLYLFRMFLELALIGIVLYWLAWFHDAWKYLSYFVLFMALFAAIMVVMGLLVYRVLSYSSWYERLHDKPLPFRLFALQMGIWVVAGVVAVMVTPRLHPYLLRFLDGLAQVLGTTTQ